eukprot:gene10450-biopygen7764
MGPEVGPAFQLSFQRLSREPLSAFLSVRWAETGSRHLRNFRLLSRVGARYLAILAFAPRSGPPHARATGAQMIRMASGSSLAFQRLSREPLRVFLSVRLATHATPAPCPLSGSGCRGFGTDSAMVYGEGRSRLFPTTGDAMGVGPHHSGRSRECSGGSGAAQASRLRPLARTVGGRCWATPGRRRTWRTLHCPKLEQSGSTSSRAALLQQGCGRAAAALGIFDRNSRTCTGEASAPERGYVGQKPVTEGGSGELTQESEPLPCSSGAQNKGEGFRLRQVLFVVLLETPNPPWRPARKKDGGSDTEGVPDLELRCSGEADTGVSITHCVISGNTPESGSVPIHPCFNYTGGAAGFAGDAQRCGWDHKAPGPLALDCFCLHEHRQLAAGCWCWDTFSAERNPGTLWHGPHRVPHPPRELGQAAAPVMGKAPLPVSGLRLAGTDEMGGGVGDFGIFRARVTPSPARKSAPRAARPPPPAARPGRAEGADGTGGWSSFPTTVSGHTLVHSWRPVGGNGVQALFALFAFCHGWEQETRESRPSRGDPDRRARTLRARKRYGWNQGVV